MRHTLAPILTLSAALFAAPALAADGLPAFASGTWTIEEAAPAPWVKGDEGFDDEAANALLETRVTFSDTRIEGEGLLACEDPNYRLVNGPAESLFQGGLDEMHRKDPANDPAAIAAKLGYRSNVIETLQTGCEHGIDFHFIDHRTAQFALDNYVFTLRK